jgi:hypothetical protein
MFCLSQICSRIVLLSHPQKLSGNNLRATNRPSFTPKLLKLDNFGTDGTEHSGCGEDFAPYRG